MANGIFSWGVYFGYGLAYIYGRYLTKADVLDQGWRSSYVIGGAPGVVIGALILLTLRESRNSSEEKAKGAEGRFLSNLAAAFCQPTMVLLLLSASVRQLAGLSWANNNVNYFEEYYADIKVSSILTAWLAIRPMFTIDGRLITTGSQCVQLEEELWVWSLEDSSLTNFRRGLVSIPVFGSSQDSSSLPLHLLPSHFTSSLPTASLH